MTHFFLFFYLILYSFVSMSEIKTNSIVVQHNPEIKESHESVHDNPWLKLKKNKHFIYAQRKGTDSIAFVLLATNISDTKRIGLTHEYKDPIDRFVTTAFGGSIDDEKYHHDLRTLVKEEVLEESGFKVGVEDINYYGKVLCSTQMNQFVHLFTVKVDKSKQGEKTTTNPTELKASVQWLDMQEVAELEDWKAITTLVKVLNKKDIHFMTNPPGTKKKEAAMKTV